MRIRLLAVAMLLGWSLAGFADHDGRQHVIPLFVPADAPSTGAAGQQQGFLRIINHSNRAGTVEIYGYDDMGTMMGPATLSMEAMQTVHVNSGDVENGNEGKGLPGGIGDGAGDWHLVLASDNIDIEPLAYVRTRGDGLLISVHDMASAAGTMHRVPVFNPGDNANQRSTLRVVNMGDDTASVTITGVDDSGAPGEGSMSVTVPPHGATAISAADVEAMGLGDGAGKWSLAVMSDHPVHVMSLMDTPSGHLANLSAGQREYRAAAGLWHVAFDDGMGGDGYLILLSDSRLYAWLPEDGLTRIARGTYGSSADTIEGMGVVYESGKVELDGFTPVGGADDVTLTAMYRSGDWIEGEYTVAGESSRAFRGWAFTGFERGGATADIAGQWTPLDDDADLAANFNPQADGSFEGSLEVESPLSPDPLTCTFYGTLDPVNPAYNAFFTPTTVDCGLLVFGGEGNEDESEMFLSVMDAPDRPGAGTRAIVFSIQPREVNELAVGAVYQLMRE